jgi:hypothetical protein
MMRGKQGSGKIIGVESMVKEFELAEIYKFFMGHLPKRHFHLVTAMGAGLQKNPI